MRNILLALTGCLASLPALAQWSQIYTYTTQSPANHNYTIIDQLADSADQLYLLYSDDPAKIMLFSKLDALGNVLWTDTLGKAPYPQVNVTAGRLFAGQGRVFVTYTGYGTYAAPMAAVYQSNGTFLGAVNLGGFSTVWTYAVHGIHPLPGGSFLAYYSYGDQFAANDTFYVKKFNNAFSTVWTQKYFVPKMTWHSPSAMGPDGRLYFTYTNDSVAAGQHFTQCYTRCIDTNGIPAWIHLDTGVCHRFIRFMPSGDPVLSGPSNPNGSLMGNNTGDVVTVRLSVNNGNEVWRKTYTGPAGEREEVYSIAVDAAGNLYLGGVEDIHDYQPFINRSVLLKYDANGQQQALIKGPNLSAMLGVFVNPQQQLLTTALHGSTVWNKRWNLSNWQGMDSISFLPTYAVGMNAVTSNANSDLFYSYTEGHCGGNHFQATRFCSRSACGPNGLPEEANTHKAVWYPNPGTGRFLLAGLAGAAIRDLRVINTLGQMQAFQWNGSELNLEHPVPGTYYVSYRMGEQSNCARLLVW
jgi:hypothetical protein